MSGILSDTIPVLVLHSCSPPCQLGWCQQRGSVITTLMNFTIGLVCYPTILQVFFGVSLSEPDTGVTALCTRVYLCLVCYSAILVTMVLTSFMPRPFPVMRKGGLVNQVEFLGLVCALELV